MTPATEVLRLGSTAYLERIAARLLLIVMLSSAGNRAWQWRLRGVDPLEAAMLFAIQWTYVMWGAVFVAVMFGIFLVPYLIKEIRTGKGELGPVRRLRRGGGVTLGPPSPTGAGDNNPGRPGDPAPGMPDGQSDPWGARAQRGGPPIRS